MSVSIEAATFLSFFFLHKCLVNRFSHYQDDMHIICSVRGKIANACNGAHNVLQEKTTTTTTINILCRSFSIYLFFVPFKDVCFVCVCYFFQLCILRFQQNNNRQRIFLSASLQLYIVYIYFAFSPLNTLIAGVGLAIHTQSQRFSSVSANSFERFMYKSCKP